jgi:translation initiation factor IF-3
MPGKPPAPAHRCDLWGEHVIRPVRVKPLELGRRGLVLYSRGDREGRGFAVAGPGTISETFERGATISRDLRINEMIRIPQVRVIDDEGNQLGVMPTPKALDMAQEKGLDLVEVAPMAAPPVVRFLDFGQYKYELTKREKENKRRQRSVTFKEVRLSPKIGTGDFQTKLHRAVEFLEDGDRIKVTVRFRGRELSHPELGRVLLERFSKQVEEHGVIERQPVLEGKSMFIVLASTHKPKVIEAVQRPARPDDQASAGLSEPAETLAPTASVEPTNGAAGPAKPSPAVETENETTKAAAAAAKPAKAPPEAAKAAAEPKAAKATAEPKAAADPKAAVEPAKATAEPAKATTATATIEPPDATTGD